MIYLLGDSHANEIAQSSIISSHNTKHHTLLGFGLQSLAGTSKYRQMDEQIKNQIMERICGLDKGSLIFLSYTDVDARLGMGEEVEYSNLYNDYQKAINIFFENVQPKKLIILDWYGIIKEKCHEQNCSVEQRKKNRTLQLEVLNKMNIDFDTTFNDFSSDNEFTDNIFLRDSVHYNFRNEHIASELKKRFNKMIEENK